MTEIGDLYLTVFWWTLGLLAVAWVVLAGAMIALRRRTIAMAGGDSSHSTFDLAWAVAPALIVMLVAVPAVRGAIASTVSPGDAGVAAAVEAQGSGGSNVDQGADTEQTEAGQIATPASGELESRTVCCESVRLETTTEQDDTEADDLAN